MLRMFLPSSVARFRNCLGEWLVLCVELAVSKAVLLHSPIDRQRWKREGVHGPGVVTAFDGRWQGPTTSA
eukprot:15443696-Alexandrium_andersonii.AAC.1